MQPFQNSSSFADTSPVPRIFSPFSSPASICTNTTLAEVCDSVKVGGVTILSPELLPCCLMALILGLTFAHKTLKAKAKNSLFHAITFAMIGVMMTDAGWVDCIVPGLFPQNKFVQYYYGIIDVGLTSTIGYAFLIDGLLDAGVLQENRRSTWIIFGAGAAAIFAGWTYTFIKSSMVGYFILYMGVVGIGCGAWTIIQLKLVIEQKDWASLKWLIFAGLHGGFGFYSIISTRLKVWLCEHISCHFGSSFIWFLVTDTAMYFIYRYYKSRAKCQKKSLRKGEGLSLNWI